MGFVEFLEDSRKEIPQAVSQNLDGMNDRQKSLLPYYVQYRLIKKSENLVYATWVLAAITAILAIISFLK